MTKREPSSKRAPVAAGALFALLALLYPFWAHWGLTHWGVAPVAGLLALMALGRANFSRDPMTLGSAALALLLSALGLATERDEALLFYPVLMNALGLVLFAGSLKSRPVIERFARMKHPNLPPEGVRWCRKVTVVWCVFFLVNGSAALATVLSGDRGLWTLYNGFVSYLLMGLLFAGEWLLRPKPPTS